MTRIDFVSDVSCPWCVIGLKALEAALARLGDEVQAEIHFQPFELNPQMPPEGQDIAEHLAQKYGATPEQARAHARGDPRARRGARLHVPDGPPQPHLQHLRRAPAAPLGRSRRAAGGAEARAVPRLLHRRREPGRARRAAARRRARWGSMPQRAQQVLDSGAYADEVRERERFYQAQGIHAVPAVIIDDRHLIQGGQPVEVFEQALRQIASPRLDSDSPGPRPRGPTGAAWNNRRMEARPLCLTMGDACGIGPEILVKAFRSGQCEGGFVLGDVGVMRRAAVLTGGMFPVASIESAAEALRCPARLPAGAARDGAAGATCSMRRSGRSMPAPARPPRPASARPRRWRWPARWRASSRHRSTRRRWPRRASPSRATPRCCRPGRAAAGAHDARQRRAAHGAGDDPPFAAPRDRTRDLRRRARDAAHRPSRRGGMGAGRAAHRRRRAQPARRRGRAVRRRGDHHHRPGHCRGARRGHRRARPVRARHGLHARPPHRRARGRVRPGGRDDARPRR